MICGVHNDGRTYCAKAVPGPSGSCGATEASSTPPEAYLPTPQGIHAIENFKISKTKER